MKTIAIGPDQGLDDSKGIEIDFNPSGEAGPSTIQNANVLDQSGLCQVTPIAGTNNVKVAFSPTASATPATPAVYSFICTGQDANGKDLEPYTVTATVPQSSLATDLGVTAKVI